MRVYLPSTITGLSAVLQTSEITGAPLTGFAVTPGLREWYLDDDEEELEFAAMLEAARGSLRLLDVQPGAARRRVVIAAEVPEAELSVRDDLDRGVVRLSATVPLSSMRSVHVDDAEAESAVAAAAAAITAADLGDPAAQDVVDDADGFALSWYATQEIGPLLALM